MRFQTLFPNPIPVLAMVHLKGNSREDRLERARNEIAIYYENGVDAVIVEDYFGSKHDAEAVLDYLSGALPGWIYGVNILDNVHRSYELAVLYGGSFIQIDSVAGHLTPTLDIPYGSMLEAYRNCSDLVVLGGVRFKYQPLLSGRSLEQDLSVGRSRCDALVVTGPGTGLDTDDAKIAEFRSLIGDFPLLVGAGVTPETAAAKLTLADGAIVGSCFKDTGQDTGDVCPQRVASFMAEIQRLRSLWQSQ